MEYKKTVIDKVLECCDEAFSANTPIVYILTDEMEIIDEIVYAQNMVELLVKSPDGKIISYDDAIEKYDEDFEPINYKVNEIPLKTIKEYPEIYVFKHFNIAKDKDELLAKYVNAHIKSKPGSFLKKSVAILAAPTLKLPEGIEAYVQVIEAPYPDESEIKDILYDFNKSKYNEPLSQRYVKKLSVALKGFRKSKIIYVLKKIISRTGYLTNEYKLKYDKVDDKPETIAFEIIRHEKEQILKKSGKLHIESDEAVNVGGLKNLIDWISEDSYIIENIDEAEKWSIESPKGCLICGIPGSGKSLMARLSAQILNIPLVSMDIGSLMGKYLGESEENLRKALSLAEAIAPCVIWIDEIEKGFAGLKGGETSGTLERSFANFLNWLQNKKAPCFVFATANSISNLPPEFLRRGRFDKKFYVFMPMQKECAEIFSAILKQTLDNSENLFDPSIADNIDFICDIVDYCVKDGKKKFLTGADIAGIINDAIKLIYIDTKKKKISPIGKYKIEKKQLKSAIENVIDQTKTYGETNLNDIAQCYISLKANEFSPASENDRVLFEFDSFDESSETPIKATSDNIKNIYDKVLFDTLKEEINNKYKEIMTKNQKS